MRKQHYSMVYFPVGKLFPSQRFSCPVLTIGFWRTDDPAPQTTGGVP
jgi:hypothetical protein